jgi:hypothetical protein
MEERMVRRVDRPRLDVREAFEPTRLSPQCLISAYVRVIPIRRASLRKSGGNNQEQADMPVRRGGSRHG